MSLGTLGGFSVSRAHVFVGAWGNYWIDVDLTEPETITGQTSFVCGGATMVCTVVSGGAVDGRAAYRLAGGKAGWGKTIPAKPYRDDSGVKIQTVASDAASEVGEAVEGFPSDRVGPHFARGEGAASQVLHLLAPQSWRVDFDGVTRFGLRPPTAYTGDAPRTRRDPGGPVIEVATEDLTGLVPGVTIDGSAPATDVEYVLDSKRLTARVYAGAKLNRRLEAQRKIYEALFPDQRYAGTFEFRVVTQEGERLNLQPVRTATGLPDLAGVPVRPGMAGLKAKVLPGSLVLVTFVDRDPSRPAVTSHDAPDAPGWMPLELDFGGPAALGVAILGCTVQAGPFAGVITSASLRVKATL
jgi:hypothetical protein